MAGRGDFPLASAIQTVKAGISARAGLRAFRAGGGVTGDAKWFRMVSEARRAIGDRVAEATRPLNRRPTGTEITQVSSRVRTGFWQEVEIFLRDRSTGDIRTQTFTLRGQGLSTRQAVIRFAVDEANAGSAGSINNEDDEVLGAAYVSTLELVPGG
jgi:hypothetical protein